MDDKSSILYLEEEFEKSKEELLLKLNINKNNNFNYNFLIHKVISCEINLRIKEYYIFDNKFKSYLSEPIHNFNEKNDLRMKNIKDVFKTKQFSEILKTIVSYPKESIVSKRYILGNPHLKKNEISYAIEFIFNFLTEKEKNSIQKINNKILELYESYNNQNPIDPEKIIHECKTKFNNEKKLNCYHKKLMIFLLHKNSNINKNLQEIESLEKNLEEKIIFELLKSKYIDIICYLYTPIVEKYLYNNENYVEKDYKILYSPYLYNKSEEILSNGRLLYSLNLLLFCLRHQSYCNSINNITNIDSSSNEYMNIYENLIKCLDLNNEHTKNIHILYVFLYGTQKHIEFLIKMYPEENYEPFYDLLIVF